MRDYHAGQELVPPGSRSNHEEPMAGVAAELLDQAIFPIEIGLHRRGRDLGALIGTPVAVRRIGFWQTTGGGPTSSAPS